MKKKKLLLSLVTISMLFGVTSCNVNGKSETTNVVTNENSDEQNTTNTGNTAATSDTAPVVGFEISTDLTELKKIHTEEQAKYLAYQGKYDEMPTSQYPDGLKHISEPNPVKLDWKYSPAEGKTLSSYSVTFGRQADLSDGYELKGLTKTSAELYNVYLGKNYFKINANYSDNTVESSEIKSFNVEGTYPRNLKIEGMTNCRDMGGRALKDGGTIKQGMIFRTSGTNGWGLGRAVIPDDITAAGKEELFNHLKAKTEINVNSSGSNQAKSPKFVDAYMDYGGGKHHFFRNVESVKKVFKTLADESNYPVFYHCRIGTDRTGLIAILVNGLLGVDKNDILQDYLFSNFGNIQEKRYLGDKAGEDNILNYIADIESMPGTNLQNKIYNILLSVGVTKQQLDSVINILTDGTKATGNDAGQVQVLGKDLVGEGVTAQSSSNRNHPEKYFVLNSNSKSVKYTLNLQEAQNTEIVAYLGNSEEKQTSKYIDGAITLTVDGNPVTVSHKNYKEAGFGNCSGRMNYAPVILGSVELAKGEHEIKITGTSNTMNIGGIAIFKADASSETPTPTPTPEKTGIEFAIANATGFNTSESKMNARSGDQSKATWTMTNIPQGTYEVYVNCKMTNSGHNLRTWANQSADDPTPNSNPDSANESDFRYWVEIGGTKINPTVTETWGDLGLNASSFEYAKLCEITLTGSETSISLVHGNIGYSLFIAGIKLVQK